MSREVRWCGDAQKCLWTGEYRYNVGGYYCDTRDVRLKDLGMTE